MSAPASPWLTAKEAAKYARMGQREILAALADGELIGNQRTARGKWRINVADVDRWVRGLPPEQRTPARPITGSRRAS